MNDDLHRRIEYTGRVRRRKRSVQGKDWAVPTMQDKHSGEWCPACRKRHPYNGTGRLATSYEKRGLAWVLLWICPATGNVVGELWTGAVNFPDGQRQIDEENAGKLTNGEDGDSSSTSASS